jgi:hypothetical protein
MPRITNSEQVILFLRNRLQRSGKSQKRNRTKSISGSLEIPKAPLERVQSMAQGESLSDDDIKKALIRGLLTEEFGSGVANDPGFQKVVDDVLQAISEDENGVSLLESSILEIKAAPQK